MARARRDDRGPVCVVGSWSVAAFGGIVVPGCGIVTGVGTTVPAGSIDVLVTDVARRRRLVVTGGFRVSTVVEGAT